MVGYKNVCILRTERLVMDMEDSEIIELYFARSELATWKTDKSICI